MTRDSRKVRQGMLLWRAGVHNVQDAPTANRQGIGDERAVASPRHGLGAHDGSSPVLRYVDELLQCSLECSRLHEVCVAPKCLVSPAPVWRIRSGSAPSTERSEADIVDASGGKALGQRIVVEMREPA